MVLPQNREQNRSLPYLTKGDRPSSPRPMTQPLFPSRLWITVFALLSVAATVAPANAQADEAPIPRERQRITEQMKRSFETRVRERAAKSETTVANEGDTIELDPITIIPMDRYFVFDHEKKRIEERKFTWKDGGTFFRRDSDKATVEWMIQYDPRLNKVRLFNVSF